MKMCLDGCSVLKTRSPGRRRTAQGRSVTRQVETSVKKSGKSSSRLLTPADGLCMRRSACYPFFACRGFHQKGSSLSTVACAKVDKVLAVEGVLESRGCHDVQAQRWYASDRLLNDGPRDRFSTSDLPSSNVTTSIVYIDRKI